MAYNFSPFKDKLSSVEKWLVREMAGIRTGQATPLILDLIQVEAYGSKVPVKEVASINVEDSRTLRIAPWDTSVIKDIERAIITSDLGLSVAVDESSLRVVFPSLTAERRVSFIKLAKEKLEEAKISVRKEREKILKELDAKEDSGELNEDGVKKLRSEVQKLVDEINKKLDELRSRKEKEISA